MNEAARIPCSYESLKGIPRSARQYPYRRKLVGSKLVTECADGTLCLMTMETNSALIKKANFMSRVEIVTNRPGLESFCWVRAQLTGLRVSKKRGPKGGEHWDSSILEIRAGFIT